MDDAGDKSVSENTIQNSIEKKTQSTVKSQDIVTRLQKFAHAPETGKEETLFIASTSSQGPVTEGTPDGTDKSQGKGNNSTSTSRLGICN